jgi:outer membrane translocation and assembly module TamA
MEVLKKLRGIRNWWLNRRHVTLWKTIDEYYKPKINMHNSINAYILNERNNRVYKLISKLEDLEKKQTEKYLIRAIKLRGYLWT